MKWYNFVMGIVFLIVSAIYMAKDDYIIGVWHMGLAIVNFIFYLDFKIDSEMNEIKKKLDSK